MTGPRRIPQPTFRLAEIAAALACLPKAHRRRVQVALGRMGDDRGWHPEIRGLCIVLSAALDDLEAGHRLRDQLDALDQTDVTDGSLSWAAEVADDPDFTRET